jgi:hypothetical protein
MDCSSSGVEESVVKPLQHLAHQEGAFALFIQVFATPSRHPYDDIAVYVLPFG